MGHIDIVDWWAVKVVWLLAIWKKGVLVDRSAFVSNVVGSKLTDSMLVTIPFIGQKLSLDFSNGRGLMISPKPKSIPLVFRCEFNGTFLEFSAEPVNDNGTLFVGC